MHGRNLAATVNVSADDPVDPLLRFIGEDRFGLGTGISNGLIGPGTSAGKSSDGALVVTAHATKGWARTLAMDHRAEGTTCSRCGSRDRAQLTSASGAEPARTMAGMRCSKGAMVAAKKVSRCRSVMPSNKRRGSASSCSRTMPRDHTSTSMPYEQWTALTSSRRTSGGA